MQSNHGRAIHTGHPSTTRRNGCTTSERITAVLDCIVDRDATGDAPPTIREIQAEAGIGGRLTVERALDHLEHTAGLIRRIPGQARNIRLTAAGRAATAAELAEAAR